MMEGDGFTLFLREGCSLCEAMLEELRPYRDRHDFRLEVVDVDTSPELMNQYGAYVPVLVGPEGEICHYFLDPDALDRSLTTG